MPHADLRSLQRLAGPSRGGLRRRRRHLVVRHLRGVPAATRRPFLPRPATLVLAMAVAVTAYLGVVAAGQAGESPLAHAPAAPPADGDVVAARRDAPARADRSERGDGRQALPPRLEALTAGGLPAGGAEPAPGQAVAAFAQVEGVALGLPHDEPVAVAFHEASRPDALELAPVGRLDANDNATKYTAPDDREGPGYRVLSSRGRARPATSAVDVVVPAGTTALAPVSGEVVEARDYLLYGSLRDWRVVIRPDERPDLHVVLIHLHEPAVRAGDRVVAGTPLAIVRQLPFTSHVDYVVGERHPHVHLEVRPATARKPHDPNEPAMDAHDRLEEVTGTPRGGS